MLLTWNQTEFLLKGVYLGLLVSIAWLIPTVGELAMIALITVVGLGASLGIAAYQKIREGYQVKGRVLGFVIFLLLENPGMVYAGLILGLAAGAMLTFNRRTPEAGVDPETFEAIPFQAILPVLGG